MALPISRFQVIETSPEGGEELVHFNYAGERWEAHIVTNAQGHWATDSMSISCLSHPPSENRRGEVGSILTQVLRGQWSD